LTAAEGPEFEEFMIGCLPAELLEEMNAEKWASSTPNQL
jgi:hypothetical protein